MSTRDDGGPAFPGKFVKYRPGEVGNDVAIYEDGEGLSLRDYFAAKAMQMKFGSSNTHIGIDEMASKCYAMADAMLAERAK